MTEQRATYGGAAKALRPETLLPFEHPEFESPNDADVRALKNLMGMTGSELSKIVGVDSRTWRSWSAPPSTERRRAIPYAAWRLLLIECGVVRNSAEYCSSGKRHNFAVMGRLGVSSSPYMDDMTLAAEAAGTIATCVECGAQKRDPTGTRVFYP